MRLSIDITPEQHQRLKAVAALQGKTIKDYVLERSLPNLDAKKNHELKQLEAFISSRVSAAKQGDLSNKSLDNIFDEVLEEDSLKK